MLPRAGRWLRRWLFNWGLYRCLCSSLGALLFVLLAVVGLLCAVSHAVGWAAGDRRGTHGLAERTGAATRRFLRPGTSRPAYTTKPRQSHVRQLSFQDTSARTVILQNETPLKKHSNTHLNVFQNSNALKMYFRYISDVCHHLVYGKKT